MKPDVSDSAQRPKIFQKPDVGLGALADFRAGALRSHSHHCSGATFARTCSMCSPQPVQVVLPHVPHRTGLHICG